MNPSTRLPYKNRILAALPKAEIARLQPHLSPVTLKLRQSLLDGDASHAYFVEEGLASVVLLMEGGSTVEVGVIGKDGVVGLPILLGADGMPGQTFIQVEGSGYRIKAQSLKEAFERPGELRRLLHKYLLVNLGPECAKRRLQPAAHDWGTAFPMAAYVPRPCGVEPYAAHP